MPTNSHLAPLPTVHNSESEHEDSDDVEGFSVATGNQEGNFSSGEEGEIRECFCL